MSGKWQSSWRCSHCPESLAGHWEGSVQHLAVGSWPASPGPCQLQTCTPPSEAASPGGSTQPDRGFMPCPGLPGLPPAKVCTFRHNRWQVRGQSAPPRCPHKVQKVWESRTSQQGPGWCSRFLEPRQQEQELWSRSLSAGLPGGLRDWRDPERVVPQNEQLL